MKLCIKKLQEKTFVPKRFQVNRQDGERAQDEVDYPVADWTGGTEGFSYLPKSHWEPVMAKSISPKSPVSPSTALTARACTSLLNMRLQIIAQVQQGMGRGRKLVQARNESTPWSDLKVHTDLN